MAERSQTRMILRAALLCVAMLALAASSVAAALLLGGWAGTLVPLGIACATAAIVAVGFMEVPHLDAVSAISAALALALVAVLFGLTFTDELTRAHIPPGFGGMAPGEVSTE
ncbi:hypothetical protein [Roseivivax isoporae]|uniref:Uncharacterized protein n=1 Tax=Roseivivax isoporae LMG 25204 TaxID=1449351 RepID=X7FAD7_9RHOB|nr:hypothetical protein [Roseivivax isoporae]ETX29046.1 hypothetical protein RISW2_03635 [Roseivivax isoporae LMG 25204]